MSIHKSLKLKNTLVRQRSVLTRWERIEKLKEQDRWQEGDSVIGLPKVRTKFKIRSRKQQKREEAEAKAAEQEAGAGAQEAAGADPERLPQEVEAHRDASLTQAGFGGRRLEP